MRRNMKISGFLITGIVIFGILVWSFLLPKMVTKEASYIQLPIEGMFSEADYIFKGTIVDISETKWNQDSLKEWEGDGSLPYHEIIVKVEKSFSGNLQGEVALTIIGNMPLDEQKVMNSEYDYAVGDDLVFFARQTEIIWKGAQQRKPVIMLMGHPDSSVLREEKDGLWQAFDGSSYQLNGLEEVISQKKKEAADRGLIPPVSEP